MSTHCCDEMDEALAFECPQHPDRWDCPDALITYSPQFREYGLIIHDGTSSKRVIAYCPHCGSRLPPSLRDAWFDHLDALGLEPEDPRVPAAMHSDAWWKGSGTQP